VGIQKGHMKMHLLNILKPLNASEKEIEHAKSYFDHRAVSYQSIREYLEISRAGKLEIS
jgi:hydroxymethylglutaryl-CoA reductase